MFKINKNFKIFFFLILIFWFTNADAQKVIYSTSAKASVLTLKDWLITNPIPDFSATKDQIKHKGFADDFLKEIGGEKHPVVVENRKFNMPDGKENYFFRFIWKKDYLDLTEPFGKLSDVFVYLYAEVESKTDQNVFLHVGTNDAGKVWVNGNLVIYHPDGRSAEPSQNIARTRLKKGKNSIVLKIDQLGGGWGAYVQIYNTEAQRKYENRKKDFLKKTSEIVEIIKTKVICKQKDRYIGWPSVTKTRSGKLLVVFSGNRDAHICPYGIDQMITSDDHGKIWSDPLTINNTPLDDRDAGILETKSGTWIISWFTSMAFDTQKNYIQHPEWKRHRDKISQNTIDRWLGSWTRRSEDQGQTWGDPVKHLVSSPHGPIQLKDGRIFYVGTATISKKKELAVEISEDDGKTWKLLSSLEIADGDKIDSYSEPHTVEMPDGKLITMFRYTQGKNNDSFLRQSDSYDGGRTWTQLHKTNIWGYPPHLLLLKNGWILLSYGVRKIPYSERACISKDGGVTWDTENEIVLSLSDSADLGYPASVELDDGSILTVYYQIDRKGEKPSLMQTHWKFKK